jgi:hypothetical protein
VGGQDFPKPNERPHDGNVDLNGSVTSENAGEHGNTLFGEGMGTILEMLTTL